MISTEEIDRANIVAAERLANEPVAIKAWYDTRINRVFIALSTGYELAFAPQAAQGLETASATDLDSIEITPSGLGIHFPKLDADLYLPTLIEGSMGSKKWKAGMLSTISRSVPSQSKAEAA